MLLGGLMIHYLLAALWKAAEVGRFWAAAYAVASIIRQGSWWPIPPEFWLLVGCEIAYLAADQLMLRWEAFFYPRAEARLATEAATEDLKRGDQASAQARAAQAQDLGTLANRYGCRFAASAAAVATNAAAATLTAGLPGLVAVVAVLAVTWRASRRTSSIAVAARAAMEEHRSAAAGALASGTAGLGLYTQEINAVAAQRRRIELAEAQSDLRVSSASSLATVVLLIVAASGGASAEALVGLYRGLATLGAEAAWIAAATARMAEARTLWRELRAK
jgi:hypothetical protein